MNKKKKRNGHPPLSAADALKQGREQGVRLAMAIMFATMMDVGYLKPEETKGFWEKVEYLSDSIAKGYVNATDLRRSLNEEYGLNL